MIEDSLVIYRLSRAPERRIFYIDVGNLPKVKAEQYLRDVMMRYRNKLVYDANTGEIRDDKKYMAMLEDFWLPRREGGRGTEISTLPGGQNLGEITDIEYFKKKLYRSLNVPPSRMDGEGGFNLGRSSEILRDELKFTKFVGRLRKRFSHMFNDILKTQLILKNIITPEDWDKMSEHIQYDFLYDNHFSELKETELFTERLNNVATAEPYVGRYFSQDYLRRKVLRQTDEEIIEQNEIMAKEIADGTIPDPSIPTDPETGIPLDQIADMDLGADEMEPDLESEAGATKAPEIVKGRN
jgi:Bacteriophage T4-like capsid assembly protein (Gp20).